MADTQTQFRPSVEKRRILVVEDEFINQEILKMYLSDTYEVFLAGTGEEALDILQNRYETISLILLDLNLPDIHGLDVLRTVKDDSRYARIPVIVMTADSEAEVECLTLGAIDFIPKPYPQQKVVLARVLRTIELSEDRDILRWTERDQLTGLYNKEFFFRYAVQLDVYHKDYPTDAILVNINHFHTINDRYGKAYGDNVLRGIGKNLLETVQETGGIACRSEADNFLIYCPHRTDYESLLEQVSVYVDEETHCENRIHLRMGVYSCADKNLDIERRFDRAKMSSDKVKGSFTNSIGIYDDSMHDAEVLAEQLIEDFPAAIREKQFMVYYQPKINVRPEEPILSSAEALIRWKHPKLGMVSPGVFIPLFEDNGLIQTLDNYVWSETAAQIRDWKERLGITLPVSVNVSRVDMYDPDMVKKLQRLIEDNGLTYHDLFLEITESAYTDDSRQIIEKVEQLRKIGFRIEMDDFGSGYSSLNMLSTLPIDALKLDMQFIRNAFSERRDTSMLEIVFEIAEMLGVPTIAEGVETEEQMLTLKVMGCDIVQGYYFSRPLPADEFEPFLIKRIDSGKQEDYIRDFAGHMEHGGGLPGEAHVKAGRHIRDHYIYMAIHDPLTGLFNRSGFDVVYRDTDRNNVAILILRAEMIDKPGSPLSDRSIVRTTEILQKYFRSVDRICRWKDDEFVIIMSRINSSMKNRLLSKLARMNEESEADGLILTGGAAFSDPDDTGKDILSAAQEALEESLSENKGGCIFR